MNGLQTVDCRDCGQNLGYQEDGTEIIWDYWVHTRCPVRIARQLNLTSDQYDKLFRAVTVTIRSAYPDFGPTSQVQTMRAKIAAGAALETLGVLGCAVQMKDNKDD
jgi:hypothetical protein